MKLGILLAPGESLKSLEDLGQADRLRTYYLPAYRQAFDEVIVFSYPNHFPLIRFLYLFIMPFVTRMKECGVIRVMQATSILPAVLTKWFFGTKVVTTFGYNYAVFAKAERKYLQAFFTPLYLHFLRFSDMIISTTHDLAQTARSFCGNAQIVLIPNGVDIDIFTPQEKMKKPPWHILYVGRMEKVKNVDKLIRAIAELSFASDIRLTCIGSGSMSKKLVALSKKLRVKTTFTGAVDHTKLPSYYADAHLFVLISDVEGHPKALLEALSAGLPCLISEKAGGAVGIQDGENGKITATTVPKITQALDELFTETDLKVMGKKAHRLAVSQYSLKKLLQEEMDVLRGLM